MLGMLSQAGCVKSYPVGLPAADIVGHLGEWLEGLEKV